MAIKIIRSLILLRCGNVREKGAAPDCFISDTSLRTARPCFQPPTEEHNPSRSLSSIQVNEPSIILLGLKHYEYCTVMCMLLLVNHLHLVSHLCLRGTVQLVPGSDTGYFIVMVLAQLQESTEVRAEVRLKSLGLEKEANREVLETTAESIVYIFSRWK